MTNSCNSTNKKQTHKQTTHHKFSSKWPLSDDTILEVLSFLYSMPAIKTNTSVSAAAWE